MVKSGLRFTELFQNDVNVEGQLSAEGDGSVLSRSVKVLGGGKGIPALVHSKWVCVVGSPLDFI